MADLRKRILTFSTGKQVKLFGNSIAIGKSLELGEGYNPNFFSQQQGNATDKQTAIVSNPYKLTQDELLELADYNIRLWMDLKDAVRLHGVASTKIFNKEGMV
jgi:hypothetical protein